MPFDGNPDHQEEILILEAVRDGISRAWCQGDYEDKNGAHCIVGWFWHVVETGTTTWPKHRPLEDYVDGLLDKYVTPCLPVGSHPVGYNDCKRRKQSDMVALMTSAINRARAAAG